MEQKINTKSLIKAIELLESKNPLYRKILNIKRYRGIIELANLISIQKNLDPKIGLDFISGLIILITNEHLADHKKKQDMISLSVELTSPMLTEMKMHFNSDEFINAVLENYIDGDEKITLGLTIPITVKKIHRFIKSKKLEIPFTMEGVDTIVHEYNKYRSSLDTLNDDESFLLSALNSRLPEPTLVQIHTYMTKEKYLKSGYSDFKSIFTGRMNSDNKPIIWCIKHAGKPNKQALFTFLKLILSLDKMPLSILRGANKAFKCGANIIFPKNYSYPRSKEQKSSTVMYFIPIKTLINNTRP